MRILVFDDPYLSSPMWLGQKAHSNVGFGRQFTRSRDVIRCKFIFWSRGRLNLLRTILEDKPLILFDEWAANQDLYLRKNIIEKLYLN